MPNALSARSRRSPARFSPPACRPWKKLNTLRPGDKIINTLFIVLEKQRTTQTKEGNTVHHIVIADNTAKMNASLFDNYGELVMPGDIVRLTGGYCAIYQQASTLYAGKHGKIERIGEFCFPFTDKQDQSGKRFPAFVRWGAAAAARQHK